jgi:hypothetical protein
MYRFASPTWQKYSIKLTNQQIIRIGVWSKPDSILISEVLIFMSTNALDVLTDPSLRSDEALKQHLLNKTASGTPWLIAEVPAN